jgi:hypothetical protein
MKLFFLEKEFSKIKQIIRNNKIKEYEYELLEKIQE